VTEVFDLEDPPNWTNDTMTFATLRESIGFDGRLLSEGGSPVLQDRLGTNRAGGARFTAYGEETTSTANDRTKFGTYNRDSFTGLDYADQRFYASSYGRFNAPDPYKASAGTNNPISWNRYSYVLGDPVNHSDRRGLLVDDQAAIECGPVWMTDASLSGPCGNPGHNDDGDVNDDSTPPPPPCEINAGIIDKYISSTSIYGDPKLSKPLANMGQAFIDAALKYDTNPAVLVAIGFQESHWGYDQRDTGSNNAFGLKNSDGLLRFASWGDSIVSASKSVDSAYNRGNRSVSDLYSGIAGAYCTHADCPNAIKSLEGRVRALGENPNYLGFDCEMRDGVLVKKQ